MSTQAPRKAIFIDRKFQTAFILKFLGLLLVGMVLFDAAAYFILNRRLESTLYSAHLTIRSVGEILLPTLLSLSIVFILLLGLAVLIMTLVLSHLIAGPLYAIRRYIDLMGEGNLDFEARLRAGDQTAPLAHSLARSLEVLNEKIAAIQSLGADVREVSRNLKDGLDQAGEVPEGVRAEAGRLEELGARLDEKAAFFQTRPPKTTA